LSKSASDCEKYKLDGLKTTLETSSSSGRARGFLAADPPFMELPPPGVLNSVLTLNLSMKRACSLLTRAARELCALPSLILGLLRPPGPTPKLWKVGGLGGGRGGCCWGIAALTPRLRTVACPDPSQSVVLLAELELSGLLLMVVAAGGAVAAELVWEYRLLMRVWWANASDKLGSVTGGLGVKAASLSPPPPGLDTLTGARMLA